MMIFDQPDDGVRMAYRHAPMDNKPSYSKLVPFAHS